MAQTTNDTKNGSALNLDGQLRIVVKFRHIRPGKDLAFMCTTIKNVLSGKIVDKTFNTDMRMKFGTMDNRTLQYSYEDGDNSMFMDMTTYDQVMVPKTLVGDKAEPLFRDTDCLVPFHGSTLLSVNLPDSVVLTTTHTEPGLQGNRSSADTRPATVETGAETQVPLLTNEGDRVKINTKDGSYIDRGNNRPPRPQQITGRIKDQDSSSMTCSITRKRALNTLYEVDEKSQDTLSLLNERITHPGTQTPLPDHAAEIVKSVAEHHRQIDMTLDEHSMGWKIRRMGAIDHNILRIAAWEILFNDDVPDKVTIDEALALAKTLCDDDSPAFIHGLLSAIRIAKNVVPAPESVAEGADEESSDFDAATPEPTDEGDVSDLPDSSGASSEPAAPPAEIQPTAD